MQLVVARIGRAHGIRGEVTVEVRTDDPELRLAPGAVLSTDPAGAGPLTVESGRVHSGRLLLRFASVADRNAAEALRNTLLIADVDPDESPEEPDEYYDHQLIDLEVVTADGTRVGRLAEISHLPSQDLFVVRRPDGSETLVPFVAEIVTEIDLDRQRIVLEPPPGLIDDAEADDDAEAGDDAGPGASAGTANSTGSGHGAGAGGAAGRRDGAGRGDVHPDGN